MFLSTGFFDLKDVSRLKALEHSSLALSYKLAWSNNLRGSESLVIFVSTGQIQQYPDNPVMDDEFSDQIFLKLIKPLPFFLFNTMVFESVLACKSACTQVCLHASLRGPETSPNLFFYATIVSLRSLIIR